MASQLAPLAFDFNPPDTGGTGESHDLIVLEQREWRPYVGIVTTLNFVRYLASLLYPEGEDARVDCLLDGDGLVIGVDVYPLMDGVAHRLAATTGWLSEGVYEEIEEKETVSFNLVAEARLKHPARSILEQEWLTGPYGIGGGKADGLELSVSGQTLRAPVRVLGSVRLTLLVPRYTYLLTVPQDEAIERLRNGWNEYAVGMPNGGKPVGLSLSAPPGAEEMAKSGRGCARRSAAQVAWPDDDEPEAGKHTIRRVHDYCRLEFEEEIRS